MRTVRAHVKGVIGVFEVFNRVLIDAVARLTERVRDCEQKLSTSSSTAMLVRINELESALEALQKSNRREFGKLWKQGAPAAHVNDVDDGGTGNDELDAFLELQRSHRSG